MYFICMYFEDSDCKSVLVNDKRFCGAYRLWELQQQTKESQGYSLTVKWLSEGQQCFKLCESI